MHKLPKLFIAAGLVAVAIMVTLLVCRKRTAPAGALEVSASEAAPETHAEIGHSSFYRKHDRPQPTALVAGPSSPVIPSTTTALSTAWEEKLDQLLGSSEPEADKAKQMLELFPQLPPEGQKELAQHLANLLPDDQFGLMRPYLTDAALPEDVSDLLLDDVLNRPNSVKLPALLEVARTAQHPKAEEAKDFLELFLDEDYGQNWDAWQTQMQQWLAANPD